MNCETCKRTYKTQKTYETHMLKKHGQKPMKTQESRCQFCGLTFPGVNLLIHQSREHHKEVQERKSLLKNDKKIEIKQEEQMQQIQQEETKESLFVNQSTQTKNQIFGIEMGSQTNIDYKCQCCEKKDSLTLNLNKSIGKQTLKMLKTQSSVIIDIQKCNNEIRCLMDDMKTISIEQSQIYLNYYQKEYYYSQKIEMQPDRYKVQEYLQLSRNNETNQNQTKTNYLYQKILAESQIQYQFDFQIMVFDIETAQYDGRLGTPYPDNRLAEIKSIQFQIGNNQPQIYLNNRMNHVYQENQKYNITEFISERLMVDEFILLLKQQKKQTIVCGFRANADILQNCKQDLKFAKSGEPLGYDLKWILKRSSFYLTPINKKSKSLQMQIEQTIMVKELEQIYFQDLFVILNQSLTEKQLRDLRDYSLNEYCRLFGVEQKTKGHTYYQMGKDFAQFGSDISDHLDYGFQDIKILQLLLKIIEYENSIKAKMEDDKIGLQATLYETVQNKLQVIANVETIEEGLAPSYKPEIDDSTEKFDGADTGVNDLFKCKIVKNCAQNDFAALYTSVVIQNNISNETIEIDINVNPINMNAFAYHKSGPLKGQLKDPEYISFSREKLGILPKLCLKIQNDRKRIREEMKLYPEDSIEYKIRNAKQLYIKTKGNTLYGFTGYRRSPMFNLNVARSITACARIALDNLKQIVTGMNLTIYAHDTDAVNTNLPDNQELNWVNADALTNTINDRLVEIYQSKYMQVTCDELMKIVCFSKCKKSYARIEYNRQMQESITIKGYSWKKINPDLHDTMKQFTKELLTTNINVQTIHNKLVLEIKRIIKNNDLQSLRKWSQIIKRASKENVAKQLNQSYPRLEIDQFEVFYKMKRYSNDSMASRAIPYQALNEQNIKQLDVQLLVSRITNQLDKIFTLEKQGSIKSQLLDIEEVETDKIIVRLEQIGQPKTIEIIPIEDLDRILALNGNKISYHELLNRTHFRFFADVDSLQNDINDPVAYITQSLFEFGYKYFNVSYATAHSETKRSWHIVTNLWMSHGFALRTAEMINSKAGYKMIDLQPIQGKQTSSLRLPNCVKIKKDQIENRQFQIEQGSLQDMIITNIENTIQIQELPCSDKKYTVIPQIEYFNTYQSNNPASLLILENYLKQNYPESRLGEIKGNIVTISGKCPLNGYSDTHGPYATLGNQIYIKCHSDKCENRLIQKLKTQIEEEKEIIIPQPRLFDFTQQNRYLDIELTHSLNFIKSDVGTGKTEQIIRDLKQNNQTCIFLTTRRALADDVKRRFQNHGLQAQSYKEIQGSLRLEINKPLIVQYESLERISENQIIDHLILDEWLSILEQIQSKLGRNSDRLLQILKQLIIKSNKVTVMDGHLTYESCRILEDLKETKGEWICNDYHPYSDYQIDFISTKQKQGSFNSFKEQVLDLLSQKKNVFCFISEKKKLKQLLEETKDKYPQLNIKYVTGDNLEQDYIEKEQKHQISKDFLLQDFNKIRDCNLFCFTSAITSGVDFSENHFDIGIHYVSSLVATPNQTIQALFRIRKLSEKKHVLYYRNSIQALQFYPYQMIQPELSNHPESNLDIISKAFKNQISVLGEKYILQCLIDMNIQIKIIDLQKNKKDTNIGSRRINQYLVHQNEDLIEKEIINYCLLNNQIQRNQFIQSGQMNHIEDANFKVQDYYQYLSYKNTIQGIENKIKKIDFQNIDFKESDSIIKQLKAFKQLISYNEQYSNMTQQQLGQIHSKQMKILINGKQKDLNNKLSIDQLQEQQRNEKDFLELLINRYPIIFIDLEDQAKKEDIEQIKKLCYKLKRPEAVQKVCQELNISDLKVQTQLKYWKELKQYFVNTGKWI